MRQCQDHSHALAFACVVADCLVQRSSSEQLLLERQTHTPPGDWEDASQRQIHFCSFPVSASNSRRAVGEQNKPLPQSAPGGIIGIVGGVVAAALILGVAITVIVVYRRQQKSRSDTDTDLIDLPPSHKPAPPPKRKQEMKSHLTPEDIQVVHLDNMKHEEEIQKLPLQTPYYDMAAPEPSPYIDKLNFGECHAEVPDAGDYLSRCYAHQDRYLEKIPRVYTPLPDLPQELYPPHSDMSFCCPPPGSRAPYICPKEQIPPTESLYGYTEIYVSIYMYKTKIQVGGEVVKAAKNASSPVPLGEQHQRREGTFSKPPPTLSFPFLIIQARVPSFSYQY
ncbi:hypothetical protein WISP_46179 [Willisornis vidua]|uniref:Uncharacterized protein n=1 Tax=Willisornis vidua TaxID=1566151 RepID=A0ABQ9DL21_9PASS|nr:hypothetical protein WISP_46179 [Willisornis vidua]